MMMKTRQTTAFILFLSLLVLGACDTNDDNNPSPVPDARDKFVGNWKVNETCSKIIYYVSITKDPSNSAQVLLNNFGDANAAQADTAIVAASSIYVFPQANSEGWIIEGNGKYNSDETIDWTYSLTISGTEDNCSSTYTRN